MSEYIETELVLPPHSVEAENGVLGCCIEDAASFDKVISMVGEDYFYDIRNRALWGVLTAMHGEGAPVDRLTLHLRLNDLGLVEKVGGFQRVLDVVDSVPSLANLEYYLNDLREKARSRRVLKLAAEATIAIRENPGQAQVAIDTLEAGLMGMEAGKSAGVVLNGEGLVKRAMDVIDSYIRGQGMFQGLPTGYAYLDKMVGGLRAGETFYLAGRPGTGKTSLCLNMLERISVDRGIPAALFSMEMTDEAVAGRLLFQMSGANFQQFRTGMTTNEDTDKVVEAGKRLSKAPLYVDFTGSMTIMELRAKARSMVRTHGVKVIAIDYFQLINPSRVHANENLALQEVSGGIMSLAKELRIPLIVLAQLNREIEKDRRADGSDRKPRMSDLRGSGSIEQDAHQIGILYRPKLDEQQQAQQDSWDDSWDQRKTFVNLYLAKNRHGPQGDVELIFHKSCMRFEDAHREQQKQLSAPKPKIDPEDYPDGY